MSNGDDPLTMRRCAEDALGYWDLDVATLEFVAAMENSVFKVICRDGSAYALRIHRQGYHSLAELESENEWTTALSDAGIDTPRPISTRMGPAFATVPFGTAGDTRQVGIIEWVDGVPLGAILEQPGTDPVALYHDLGLLMGRMHNQAEAWEPSPGFVRHTLDAGGLIGDAPWWGPFWDLPEMSESDKLAIRAARARMYQTLIDYGTEPRTYTLIHADLLPQNVIISHGRPFVIDFDDAGFGWHHYDMAVALIEARREPTLTLYRDALLRGYRTVRHFSDEDLAMLPMFLTIREFLIIGWMHSRAPIDFVFSTGRRVPRPDILMPLISRAVAHCEEYLDS